MDIVIYTVITSNVIFVAYVMIDQQQSMRENIIVGNVLRMNNRKVKLWIDDDRHPPMDYLAWCTNSTDAIRFIDTFWGRIEEISFDHDLGDESYGTGYDVLKFIEEKVYQDSWEPRMKFRIHSANPVGRQNMHAAIQSIERRCAE